jgi:putative ABC transport system substrate-binding protein
MFIVAAGLTCLWLPRLALAQRKLPKLGVMWVSDASTGAPYVAAFKQSLRDLGWVEGRTIEIHLRYDDGIASRRPAIASELVSLGVDAIFVFDPALPAARHATKSIPIVCADFFDPIAEGVTTSLARPDGNVTGVSWQSAETALKRVQLAKELRPLAQRIGFMAEPEHTGSAIELRGILVAAQQARISIEKLDLRTPDDIDRRLAKLKKARLDALIVGSTGLIWSEIARIVAAATAAGVPIISEPEEFAQAGAVVTYGVDVFAAIQRSTFFVDRILKGATPKDLPIEQPTAFDLVANVKAAKTLGLRIPDAMLAHATKVIR